MKCLDEQGFAVEGHMDETVLVQDSQTCGRWKLRQAQWLDVVVQLKPVLLVEPLDSTQESRYLW